MINLNKEQIGKKVYVIFTDDIRFYIPNGDSLISYIKNLPEYTITDIQEFQHTVTVISDKGDFDVVNQDDVFENKQDYINSLGNRIRYIKVGYEIYNNKLCNQTHNDITKAKDLLNQIIDMYSDAEKLLGLILEDNFKLFYYERNSSRTDF
jgi:hypothetical protein